MAIAGIPNVSKVVDESPTSQIKVNTKINDVAPSSTPWVDTSSSYTGTINKLPVAGYPVTGNYYQQQKELGDIGDSIDSKIDSAYQQYLKINNYVAKLTGELTYTVDTESKESTLVGELILIDVLIPNRGDVWIMERGLNLIGLFAVTNTERLSPHQGSGYRVSIELIEESRPTQLGAKFTSLESKVIKSVYYNDNSNYLGTKSTLTSSELVDIKNRRKTAKLIAGDYIREFYNRTCGTIVLDTGNGLVYDPYLTKFVRDTSPADVTNVRLFDDEGAKPNTFWENLVTRNNFFSTFIMDRCFLASVSKVQELQFMYGLHHTPVNYIVRALDNDDPSAKTELVYTGRCGFLETSTISFNELVTVEEVVPVPDVIPTLPVMGIDDNYVLSTQWYVGTPTSKLEQLVNDWLGKRVMNMELLNSILEERKSFTKLQRFYYNAILVFLLMNN